MSQGGCWLHVAAREGLRLAGECPSTSGVFRLRPSSTVGSGIHTWRTMSGESEDGTGSRTSPISTSEWQGWGTSSAVPAMVLDVILDLKLLERDLDAQMTFGGLGGKLKGDFRDREDKKHRARYQALTDSEKKLQFFSARQIACRLLGSSGYLCQKCWLAMEDCMCSKLTPCSLWNGVRLWVYMHPKDFLRQNNTGKLLWQTFGFQEAPLCLFGIREHEEIMWNAFKHAGKSRVWCLYPNKNASAKSVEDVFSSGLFTNVENQPPTDIKSDCGSTSHIHEDAPLNFILIDGTWSNSTAMFRRLKEHAKLTWGEVDLPCISVALPGVSAMHKLRPQPSWDRTCTAAAAGGLLLELHNIHAFSQLGLDKQAEAMENSLDVLLDALTARRLRKGRSITRRERKNCAWNCP